MVLVDTSVWVTHLRKGQHRLVRLLEEEQVLCHPFIIGELACGNLKKRSEILLLLSSLPSAAVAIHEEVMLFIENRRLMGKGLGYVDVHLLVSALLSNTPLWTEDWSLARAATSMDVDYRSPSVAP